MSRKLGMFVAAAFGLACFAPRLVEAVPITSGLVFHLDAQQINAADPLQVDGGGKIIRWYDQSAAGNHAGQLTAGFRPLYVADGGAAFNNQPVVRFAAASQTFVDASASTFSPFGTAFTGLTGQPGATVFTVFNSTAPTSNSVIVEGHNAATNFPAFPRVQLANSGGTTRFVTGSSDGAALGGFAFGTQVVQVGQTYLFSSIFDGSQTGFGRLELDINGFDDPFIATNSTPDATVGTVNRMLVGIWHSGSLGLTGDVAEVLVFNRALSPFEYNQVGAYLEQKYGLNTNFEVPEPSSLALLAGGGLMGWLILRRKSRRRVL